MTHTIITLREYDWTVVVFFHTTGRDCPMIIDALIDAGLADVVGASDILCAGRQDVGMTYTNYNTHTSVVIISETSSAAEFADTYFHELGHLVRHIGEYYGIDARSETEQYLAGAISKAMFPYAQEYLCDCCRYSSSSSPSTTKSGNALMSASI